MENGKQDFPVKRMPENEIFRKTDLPGSYGIGIYLADFGEIDIWNLYHVRNPTRLELKI